MAHPHHTGRKGEKGGSRPRINNNLAKMCQAHLDSLRTKAKELKVQKEK